jgi:hypothetical protein
MATISAFKSQMQGGGARPNQYEILMTFPTFVGQGSAAGNSARFLCIASSLPAAIIEDIPVFYRGRPVHFAGERSFMPWSVTVLNDTNFLIRNALETWSNRVLNLTATNGITRPGDYQTDMTVNQLDRNDSLIKSYKFYDTYPVDVGQIGLSYQSNNEIETFEVTFVYNYYTTSGI